MTELVFASLIKKYMRRIRASAKDVAEELGLARQTVLNWRKGTSMPSHCDKVVACARFLRLTEMETEEFLEAAGCGNLCLDSIAKFVRRLFADLSQTTPHPFVMLLSQNDCGVFPTRNLLLKEAETNYSPENVLHIHTPFFTSTDINKYFIEFGKQCGLKEVDNDFSFERALQARLEKTDRLFLLISRFERCVPLLREQLSGILHNLSDLYPNRLHLLLCGAEKLAELKYREGNLALLTHSTVERWPEMTRSEVYALRDYRFKGLRLNDAEVDEFLAISGAQPQLLNECLRLKQQSPHLEMEDYPRRLSDSDCVWQFFTPFTQDTGAQQQVCEWLQQEELGRAQPFILDDLLRQLYWRNLLVERDRRLYWRCDALRIGGLKILGNGEFNHV